MMAKRDRQRRTQNVSEGMVAARWMDAAQLNNVTICNTRGRVGSLLGMSIPALNPYQ